MPAGNIDQALSTTLNTTIYSVASYIPRFISGLIVLLLGIIIATFIKQIIVELFRFIKFETILKRYGVPEARDSANWTSIIAELVRWFVIVLFLVPTADLWGLGRFGNILNEFLNYLPKVFVSVMLLIVGFVVARLVDDLILTSVHGVSRQTARAVGAVARWSVLIFVFLAILTQLGIGADLVKILFQGIVGMVAIAGGLAFGLGGKDTASELLEKLKKKF